MILVHNPLGIALLHILNDNEVMKKMTWFSKN
jgi:hypothetical protein